MASRRRSAVGLAVAALTILLAFSWWWDEEQSESLVPGELARVEPTESLANALRIAPNAEPSTDASAGLSGHASTRDGTLVPGVEVCIERHAPIVGRPGNFIPRQTARCATTDDAGAYTIRALEPGDRLDVDARLAGAVVVLATEPEQPSPLAPNEHRTGVDLVVEEGVGLRVRVEDRGGGPVQGAAVTADGYRVPTCHGETDSAGLVVLACRPGHYTIHATSDGYVDARQDSDAPGDMLLVMQPGATISGHVVADAPNLPKLAVSNGHGDLTWTGADGGFTLSGLAPGAHDLVARGQGWFGTSPQSIAVEEGAVITGVEVRVRRAADVTVTIRQENGDPCTEGFVHLRRQSDDLVFGATVGDGAEVIRGVPAGSFVVLARCCSRQVVPRPDINVEEADVHLDLVFSGCSMVTGVVVDGDDRPISGANITGTFDTNRVFTTSGGDGRFAFSALRGRWSLEAKHPAHQRRTVDVDVGTESVAIRIRLDEGLRIEGMVVDDDRAPVPHASVKAYATEHGHRETRTTADGRFVMNDLAPGTYDLSATSGVHVGEGTKPAVRVPVEPPRQIIIVLSKASLSGRVLDAHHRPAARAKISVLEAGSLTQYWAINAHRSVLSEDDGRFQIAVDGQGPFALVAEHETHGIAAVDKIEGGQNVDVVLSGRDRVSGRVVDGDGQPVDGFELVVRHSLAIFRHRQKFTGSHFELALPAGSVTLVAVVPDRVGTRTIEIPVGRPLENITIPLHPPRVEGRLHAGPQPLGGISFRMSCSVVDGSTEWAVTTDDDGRFVVEPYPSCPVSGWIWWDLRVARHQWSPGSSDMDIDFLANEAFVDATEALRKKLKEQIR